MFNLGVAIFLLLITTSRQQQQNPNLTFTINPDQQQLEALFTLLLNGFTQQQQNLPYPQVNGPQTLEPISINCSIASGSSAFGGGGGLHFRLTVNGDVQFGSLNAGDENAEVSENGNHFASTSIGDQREQEDYEVLVNNRNKINDQSKDEDLKPITSPADRREAIKSLAKATWLSLLHYSPGWPPLTPKDKFYIDLVNGELVATMSTLHLMGLETEFAQGRARIEQALADHLSPTGVEVETDTTDTTEVKGKKKQKLLDWQSGKLVHQEQDLVYNLVNKHLGGLLSVYALTSDVWFLERAKEVADFVEPAYGNIPDWYHPSKGYHLDYDAMFNQQTEYRFLADAATEPKYWDRLQLIKHAAIDYQKMADSDLRTNKVFMRLKSYIQSNRNDRRGLADYIAIIEEASAKGQFPLARSGVRYFRQTGRGGGSVWTSHHSSSSTSMTDRRQSLGAMLALGAAAQKAILESRFLAPVERNRWLERVARHLELAEQLTDTFHEATSLTVSGLPPAAFAVDAYAPDRSSAFIVGGVGETEGEALAEAYLAESYFVLYRATRKEVYREYAWDLVKALAVNGTADRDYRLPHSLYASATLKYLWLIFAEEEGEVKEGGVEEALGGGGATSTSYLPLNKWVFNEAGQPLPICGAHESVWPADKCSYRLMSYQEKLVAQFDL